MTTQGWKRTERLCLYCGKPLGPKPWRHRFYCSDECYVNGPNPPVAECPVCGLPFLKITKDGHHCPVPQEEPSPPPVGRSPLLDVLKEVQVGEAVEEFTREWFRRELPEKDERL